MPVASHWYTRTGQTAHQLRSRKRTNFPSGYNVYYQGCPGGAGRLASQHD